MRLIDRIRTRARRGWERYLRWAAWANVRVLREDKRRVHDGFERLLAQAAEQSES